MESFSMLMSAISTSNAGHDLVDILPNEITEIIFRQLDPRSLLNVARVSKKWMEVCKGDCKLRRTARHHLRKERRRLLDVEGPTRPRMKKTPMPIPAKVQLPKFPSATPAQFTFRPTTGALSRGLTEPKRSKNRGSKVVPPRIMIRIR